VYLRNCDLAVPGSPRRRTLMSPSTREKRRRERQKKRKRRRGRGSYIIIK
jgi:hypothetical protein